MSSQVHESVARNAGTSPTAVCSTILETDPRDGAGGGGQQGTCLAGVQLQQQGKEDSGLLEVI